MSGADLAMDCEDNFNWHVENFNGHIYPNGSQKSYQLSLWDYSDAQVPSMYETLLLKNNNTDDVFLKTILEECFHKSSAQALKIICDIHRYGGAACEVSTKEIAETKMLEVNQQAEAEGLPHLCIIQKSSDYVIKKS